MRGVLRGARDRGRGGLQVDEQADAADRVEETGAVQLLADGDRVGRLARAVQRQDRFVHVHVRRLVEVLGADDLDRVGDRVPRQQHRAQAARPPLGGCSVGCGSTGSRGDRWWVQHHRFAGTSRNWRCDLERASGIHPCRLGLCGTRGKTIGKTPGDPVGNCERLRARMGKTLWKSLPFWG